MSIEIYKHYFLLPPPDLISLIENKDEDIKALTDSFKNMKKERDKYYDYNEFHIKEITRLDKIIGKYKGLR